MAVARVWRCMPVASTTASPPASRWENLSEMGRVEKGRLLWRSRVFIILLFFIFQS